MLPTLSLSSISNLFLSLNLFFPLQGRNVVVKGRERGWERYSLENHIPFIFFALLTIPETNSLLYSFIPSFCSFIQDSFAQILTRSVFLCFCPPSYIEYHFNMYSPQALKETEKEEDVPRRIPFLGKEYSCGKKSKNRIVFAGELSRDLRTGILFILLLLLFLRTRESFRRHRQISSCNGREDGEREREGKVNSCRWMTELILDFHPPTFTFSSSLPTYRDRDTIFLVLELPLIHVILYTTCGNVFTRINEWNISSSPWFNILLPILANYYFLSIILILSCSEHFDVKLHSLYFCVPELI